MWGDNSYAAPTMKSGGTRPPPVPHRSTPVVTASVSFTQLCLWKVNNKGSCYYVAQYPVLVTAESPSCLTLGNCSPSPPLWKHLATDNLQWVHHCLYQILAQSDEVAEGFDTAAHDSNQFILIEIVRRSTTEPPRSTRVTSPFYVLFISGKISRMKCNVFILIILICDTGGNNNLKC